MKHLISFLCVVVVVVSLLGFSVSAKAQGIPPEHVESISRMVFDHMAEAQISDGTLIGKERAAKLPYPLLPYEVRELMIVKGTISGMAEACKLDWLELNFKPLMMALRAENQYNDYQLAYAGMLHGVSMNGGEVMAKQHTPCSDDMKKSISDNMITR